MFKNQLNSPKLIIAIALVYIIAGASLLYSIKLDIDIRSRFNFSSRASQPYQINPTP